MANINKPSYIFRYHTDEQGNLINVKVESSYQVSPVNNIVMLDQIPSETERLVIRGDGGQVLTECFNMDEITQNTYYCDYNEGKVYFDATHQGKTKVISYHGRGLALISADRVFLPDSLSNGDVVETLQDLINFGRESLELIKTLGNAVIIIQKLEKNIADGNVLNDKLVSNIAIATPLQASLNKDIKDALVFKDQLKEDVADGKILNTQLNEIVNEGKVLKPELDQSLANAQGSIDKINSAGNKSYLISAEQWATNTDNTISSAFTYRLKHDMNSENLQVNGLISGFSTIVPYKTLGVNEILLISDERVNMKVIINASYYNGGADIAEEVIEARKGKGSLKSKIDNIDEQMEDKVSYFESVNAMKISNKIKVNNICKTLGYHSSNDGGKATYWITNNTPLGNAFSFSLDNGLTAELLYTDEINIKQLGARDYDDNGNRVDIKPYIELYFTKANIHVNATTNNKLLKLFIPSGRWFTSPLNMKASSIYIYGCNVYSYPYGTGTIILPLEDNQPYMWSVGDNTTNLLGREYGNIAIKNIMFSTRNPLRTDGVVAQALTYDKCYNCGEMLVISRVFGGVFENIHFTNYLGVPLKIMSSYECIYNDFSFRNGDSFEKGNVVFGADITGSKNISASFFDKFSFEGVKGDLFSFEKDSKYINNHIGTVTFEDRNVAISKNGVMRNYVVATDGALSFESKAIFSIEEQEYCELIVDNVLLNNFGRCVFTLDGKEYLFDTIVKENGKISKGQANIKTISHTGARRDTILYNKAPYEGLGTFNFNVTCENALHVDSELYKFIVKTTGSLKPHIRYKETGYKKCIDYAISPSVLFNKNGKYGYYMPVVTDGGSLLEENLVVANLNYKRYVASFSGEHSSCLIPVTGNKLHIRVKTKAGFLAQCYLSDDTTTYQNRTVNMTSDTFTWITLDYTDFRTNNQDKEMKVAIRTLTADETNYVRLDVFYWE